MTSNPTPPVIRPSLPRLFIGFLSQRWAGLLFVAATLTFAFRFMPALTLSLMNTETVMLPLVYQDIVTLHHPAADWNWPGANSLFPDDIVFFLLRFLSGSDWVAMEGTMVFFFLALVTACAGLVRASRLPHALGLVTLLVLLVVAQACDFSPGSPIGVAVQNPLFQPIYHSGTAVAVVACFALLLTQIRGTGWIGFVSLLGLIFLATISDFLFLVDFLIPAVITMGVLAIGFRLQWQRHVRLAVSMALTGVVAVFLAPYCFPAPTVTLQHLAINLDGARGSLGVIWSEILDANRRYFAFLVALDVIAVLASLVGLIAFCFFKAGRKMPAALVATVVFSGTVVSCDWGATLLTGGYLDIGENRYLVVALLLPLFVLAFGLHAVVDWRPWLENGVATAAAVFIGVCAFIPQPPSAEHDGDMALIPVLKDVMKKNNITAGLISYWRANLFTFLSNGSVTLRSETDDGSVVHLGDTDYWYGKGQPVGEGPRFRLVFPEDSALSQKYGPPDQILTVLGGETLWIYSEAHAITYNPYFDMLSNRWSDQGRTMNFTAADLSSHIGKTVGTSRIAAPGDSDDHLTYGPYLKLKSGRYRATYRYQYLTPPNPGQAAVYDLFVQREVGVTFQSVPLEYVNDQPQIMTDDFTVAQPNWSYEMRIRYHGSGTLRVDSLSVSVLEP